MKSKNTLNITAGIAFCVLASFARAQCPQICDTNLSNTALGSFALSHNTTGSLNTAIGQAIATQPAAATRQWVFLR
jgi:hypothetical protein